MCLSAPKLPALIFSPMHPPDGCSWSDLLWPHVQSCLPESLICGFQTVPLPIDEKTRVLHKTRLMLPLHAHFRYRILLVDDDCRLQETSAAIFSAQGYEVIAAANGFEALEVMRKALPELIVSD